MQNEEAIGKMCECQTGDTTKYNNMCNAPGSGGLVIGYYIK